ncbi:MAG: hypothetical protein JSW10_12880 [Pseudomonadota bacterium]|nr:MAG: hypothetical protein JSW10_12880 [Pseudomonadota bacterium]
MGAVVVLIWNTCLLQAGPQDYPHSRIFAGLLVAANISLSTALTAVYLEETVALWLPLIIMALAIGMTWTLLALRGFTQRAVQTVAALAGSDMLLTLAQAPIILSSNPGEPNLAILFVWIWGIAVTGHILRHALSVSMLAGVMIGIGYFVISVSIAELILPQGG